MFALCHEGINCKLLFSFAICTPICLYYHLKKIKKNVQFCSTGPAVSMPVDSLSCDQLSMEEYEQVMEVLMVPKTRVSI